MKTPLRILRAIAQDMPGICREPSPRDQARRETILTAATRMMAERGPHTVTLTDIAAAVDIPRGTVRYIFPDLDNLLATIIKDHLRQVSLTIGGARLAMPEATAAAKQEAARAAYISATRTELGAPLPAQILTVQYRHLLPPDEREGVESYRNAFCHVIGGVDPVATLEFLDNPRFTLRQVEAFVAAMAEMPETTWADTIPPPRPKTASERADEKLRAFTKSSGTHDDAPAPSHLPRNPPSLPARADLPRARAGP
jgi:AcrR family transcriptional regulator